MFALKDRPLLSRHASPLLDAAAGSPAAPRPVCFGTTGRPRLSATTGRVSAREQSGRPRVFLSYARDDDEPFAHRLYADLTARGFDVWFDRVPMPSRQLTFHDEIRDAIAACERLIVVVGPKAMASDYVTQEWQFAYFAANKCVNPTVRPDGRDAH